MNFGLLKMEDIDSLRKTASLGFLICALPLVVPPLVVLSAFVVAFSIPFGFLFAIYAAIDDLVIILLRKQPIPFYSESEVELGTTVIGSQLGISEASIDVEEVTVDEIEESRCDRGENGIHIEQQAEVNTVPATQSLSPFFSWGDSGDYGDLEQLLSPPEEETRDDTVGLEEQSCNVEPGDLVKATVQMVEVIRNESKVTEQSMEDATSLLPAAASVQGRGGFLDLEHVKLLSIDGCIESIDGTSRLQTNDEQMAADKEKKRDATLPSKTATTTTITPRIWSSWTLLEILKVFPSEGVR